MRVLTYFFSALFIFSVVVTLENVTNNVENSEEIHTTPEFKKGPKLNAKQVLMLNQIIGAYTLDGISDPLLFDASSKLQAGLLVGNTGEFGSFEECLQIYTSSEYGPIRGQMCTLKLVPGDSLTKSILKLSNLPLASFDKIISTLKFDSIWCVCIPDSCPNEDVLRHFNRTLKGITEGLEVTLTLAEDGCASYKTQKPLTRTQWSGIIFLSSILMIIASCTIYDVFTSVRHDKNVNEGLLMFSAYRNSLTIFSNKSEAGQNELDCLNGIKSLSMCWVVIGHRYLISMFVPIVNGLDVINWTQKLISTTVTGATVSVDSFFMVSGLLVSYLFLGAMNRGVHFNLPLFYLHRYIRVTPVVGVVIVIYATIVDLWGSGPVWNGIAKSLKEPCIKYWWSCLLHIQNYVNPSEICIVQTWYLTCEMQYYFLSPMILYPLWKWPNFGWLLWIFGLAAAVGINFYLAWKYEFNGGMPITNELLTLKYFTHHYTTPYTRAAPYLLGIALGYILYHTREKKVRINSGLSILAWAISFAGLSFVVVGSLPFQLFLHPYNRLESSLFLSLSRPAWTISLSWMVFNCINGTGGAINSFLSAYPFKVIAKLSYCMFLTHLLMMFTISGAEKTSYYFSDLSMWYMTFGDLAITFSFSYLLAICVELPIIRLDGLLRKRAGRKKIGIK